MSAIVNACFAQSSYVRDVIHGACSEVQTDAALPHLAVGNQRIIMRPQSGEEREQVR
jgi:hypothetical protein